MRAAEADADTPTRKLLRETKNIVLDCRIGLHLGEVAIGSMGKGINTALGDAVKWGRIVRNPARAATPPRAAQTKAKAPEMRTWDANTLARFLDAERGTRYHVAFLFLATTGCRRGEALGLRWSDVDLDGGRASLRHTIGAIDHRIYEKSTPKSAELSCVTSATST